MNYQWGLLKTVFNTVSDMRSVVSNRTVCSLNVLPMVGRNVQIEDTDGSRYKVGVSCSGDTISTEIRNLNHKGEESYG